MRSLRLTVSYDGTDFCGWQIQPNQRTVQGELQAAIQRITGEPVKVIGSGRTDAGVHALGQVASIATNCSLSPRVFHRAVNSELPEDVVLLDVAEAPPGFHATGDCSSKRYRYQVDNGPVPDLFLRRTSWYHRSPLDGEAMHEAAQALLGRHDFRSFESTGSERPDTVRTIMDIVVKEVNVVEVPVNCTAGQARSGTHQNGRQIVEAHPSIEGRSALIHFEVEADGFLYNMVRAIVGTLIQVGRGKQPISWPGEVLASVDRRRAGATAPPQGLFLLKANYPREIMEYRAEDCLKSAQTVQIES
jgi:tRNA pseudouridine38-40 synthase